MLRNTRDLEDTTFDLVVVGGGQFGACAAWDAAQRGLLVALIERGDFGGATSANSFKIVHGGIRYIQHGDVYRLRQSSGERRALLRIAPHLVQPLPIVIPTRGRGLGGKLALRAGFQLYDALTADRNRGISDPLRRLPRARMLDCDELRALFPDLIPSDATGGGIFCDARFVNPPRLVYSIVRSAVTAGAVVANYVEATGLLRRKDGVEGVIATDLIGRREFTIRGKTVLNAAGPYAEALLRQWELPLPRPLTYSRDACFVVPRRLLPGPHALALLGQTSDPDARLSRGARHLFLAPWRDYTLIGVWHRVQRPGSLDISVSEQELVNFIGEIKLAAPALELTLDDVSHVNSGLVPFGENAEGASNLRYGHRSALIDHGPLHGCKNLLTLIGLRMTTARFEAERAIDLVFRNRNTIPPACRTMNTPVYGGDVADWSSLVQQAKSEAGTQITDGVVRSLLNHYGAEYRRVLVEPGIRPLETIAGSNVLRGQVYHAVRAESACSLGDVVLRRTDLGTGANPGIRALRECAEIVGEELGWTHAEVERQVKVLAETFPDSSGAAPPQPLGRDTRHAHVTL